MKNLLLTLVLLITTVAMTACQQVQNDAEIKGQTIYFGGDILTMEGNSPTYAEALVEHNGRIAYVGTKADAFDQFGKDADIVDLEGKTLLPGFLDGHGHIYNTGLVSL